MTNEELETALDWPNKTTEPPMCPICGCPDHIGKPYCPKRVGPNNSECECPNVNKAGPSAEDLRHRFDRLFKLEKGATLGDELGVLRMLVGDIVIWIENFEKQKEK